MKVIKKVAKWFLILATLLIIFILILIGPIDRSPLPSKDSYQQTLARIDTIQPFFKSTNSPIQASWKKLNITPAYPMPMAGYRMRDDFKSVHDSLFCRIIAIEAGGKTAYIISADLLLFPSMIRERIQAYYQKDQSKFFYFSATHTHNGIGGWDDTLIGNAVLGEYDQQWVEETSTKIISEIESLQSDLKLARISYWETDASEYSINRVDTQSPADTKLRGVTILRNDSSKALLITYSAHATSISKKSLELSGDYPAALIQQVENRGYSFGMFLSGMVGSHRLNGIAEQEFEMVKKAGEVLSEKVLQAPIAIEEDSITLKAFHFPITFAPAQLRIAQNWKVRDWVFRMALKPLSGELTVLEMGNIMLIGTPCDFSGEIAVQDKLDSIAQLHQKHLIITSFNGDYDGYITADHHYDTSEKEEIRALNWVGPYHGEFFSTMIQKIIAK